MMFYFFLLVTVIRVFVTITCVAFVGLKIYSTLVNWFFSPVVKVCGPLEKGMANDISILASRSS